MRISLFHRSVSFCVVMIVREDLLVTIQKSPYATRSLATRPSVRVVEK
jgi:hypothetical protein